MARKQVGLQITAHGKPVKKQNDFLASSRAIDYENAV